MRIVYLDLDALNPDHLGCYGYHRDTSPTIDQIAAKGLRCTEVYASDAPCLPSRTAFYSGRFGIQTGVVGHDRTASQPRNMPDRGFRDSFVSDGLAGRLQQVGFHTAMISPFGQRHAAHHFYAGFNEIHNTGGGGMESAEEVTPVLMNWLDHHAEEDDWYLHVNFWDIHTPYRAPESFGNPFADAPLPDWLDDPDVIKRHAGRTGPHSARDINMYNNREQPKYPRHPGEITDRDSLRRMIDGYDTAILYVDQQIARLRERLIEAGVWDDTLIIISADHGECMGDLDGIYGEHGTADRGTCHIPLIIRDPDGVQDWVDDELHYHLDVAPTLIDRIGGKKPAIWDGRSFIDTLQNGTPDGRDDLVISQCAHVCQRSVRWNQWLYMRTYHDGFHLFPQEMLYDLEKDPREQNNIAGKHSEICRQGAWRLARWHDAQMQRMSPNTVDPLWTVIAEGGPCHAHDDPDNSPLPRYLEHLEATGRKDGADELRRRYPKLAKIKLKPRK